MLLTIIICSLTCVQCSKNVNTSIIKIKMELNNHRMEEHPPTVPNRQRLQEPGMWNMDRQSAVILTRSSLANRRHVPSVLYTPVMHRVIRSRLQRTGGWHAFYTWMTRTYNWRHDFCTWMTRTYNWWHDFCTWMTCTYNWWYDFCTWMTRTYNWWHDFCTWMIHTCNWWHDFCTWMTRTYNWWHDFNTWMTRTYNWWHAFNTWITTPAKFKFYYVI